LINERPCESVDTGGFKMKSRNNVKQIREAKMIGKTELAKLTRRGLSVDH
jgi:hypothetical protein